MREQFITLEHGSGGAKTMEFIQRWILSKLGNPYLEPLDDSAELFLGQDLRIAFTLDCYVVSPIFFPGGDIGSLAVYGTVNDLAMQGAEPLYLSLGLILEEGLPLAELEKILESVKGAAHHAGVLVVTGDTKVVKKGEADKVYITTSGVGLIPPKLNFGISNARPGDLVVVNGTIGDHGMAILASREELGIESQIKSDTAPLSLLLRELGDLKFHIRALKDPTRGGLATTLNEMATSSCVGIEIWEREIPFHQEVLGLSELLGLDPLYLANEGKLVAIVERSKADEIVEVMRRHPLGKDSKIIGEVLEAPKEKVLLKTKIGGKRIIPILKGIQLPRIC